MRISDWSSDVCSSDLDGLVVVVLDFAVPARRDDGLGAACFEPFAQGLAVIALVGDEFGGRRHRRDALLGNLAIMHVAGGQEQDARATLLVADGMELGVAASLRAADTMSQGPPFAPPAQRWTLMQLESMNRRSGPSPAPASAPKQIGRAHV